MIKKIANFEPLKGTLCIASAFRDISRSMVGVDFGEEIYYGLGSAFFFGYIESDKMLGLGASTDLIFDNLKENLSLSKFEFSLDDDCVIEKIKEFIDAGAPVLTKGMHFHEEKNLEADNLLKDELNLPMNLHYTTIYGYDEETGSLLMADNSNKGLVQIERFLKLRDADKKVMLLLFPKSYEHMNYRIYSGIRKTMDYWYHMPENPKAIANYYTKNHLHLHTVYNTLEGLKKFKCEFLRGDETENAEKFYQTVFFLKAISYRGSGGDLTRGLQSRFLKEAGKLTGDSRMFDTSKLYGDTAREWRQFLKMFDRNEFALFKEIQDSEMKKVYFKKIDMIYDCEMWALESLSKIAYE